METNISLIIKNVTLPSPENLCGKIDLSYEGKNGVLIFPEGKSNLVLSEKFINDKIHMIFNVIPMKSYGKYQGELTINKSIFPEGKTSYEKKLAIHNKQTKKFGKIFLEIKLLDEVNEWQKNIKLFSKKKSTPKMKQASTNINKSNIESNNKEEFDDNLSLINLSNIDEEYNADINLNELGNIEYINQLKNILENDYQKIFLKDLNALKELNHKLYDKYKDLSNKYNDILNELNSKNENLRNKTLKYLNDYKELKKELYNKRLELKNKKELLEKEKEVNRKEKEQLQNDIDKLKNDKDSFINKLTNNGDSGINNLAVLSGINNDEIKMLSDGVKKIASLGLDIIDGMKINEEERKLLSVIIGINLCDNIKNNEEEEGGREENDDNIKDDFEFGNKIVALIERDVNELYSRGIIHQIKIDQIDAITYSFTDEKKEKNVSFKIEDNNLFCTPSGESFHVWLLNNFGT